jgi:hypothetical protein
MAEHQGGAEVKLRKRKIFVAASSVVKGWLDEHGVRRGMTLTDWDAYAAVVSDENDVILGRALRAALCASRIGLPDEWADSRLAARDYDVRLAASFGLKNAKSLYPGMRDVSAHWSLGQITLSPTRHRRGSAFGGFPPGQTKGHEDIIIPFASNDAELGAAVMACFSRCL